jgi:OPA family glycerol-3-phosphate transporter-like MFS transporter 3
MAKLGLKRSLAVYQIAVFVITFLLYAAVHAVRKTLGVVTNSVIELGFTKVFISYMNAGFMLSYALGMMFTGTLGDRFRPTWVLLMACVCSALISAGFGLMAPDFTGQTMLYVYVAMWILNGLFQSCVWPTEVKLMSNWFSGNHSGAIYGIWSANGSVGNILGIQFAALAFTIWDKDATGVRWSFVIPSLFLVIVAIANFFLPDTKSDAGFAEDTESTDPASTDAVIVEPTPIASENRRKISFWRAWLLPGVIRYGLCYACIKSINYGIFYWLTPLLENAGHPSSTAYLITTLNDLGWIFGGLACGMGSDKMGTRAPFVGLFILISIIPTALIYPYVENVGALAVLSTLNGFFCGGAGNVVSSAVCADIGKNDSVKGSADVTGQVAGIVDGIGALGAAGTQLFIGYMPKDSWSLIFNVLTGMLVVAFLLIVDLVYRETRDWIRNRRLMKNEQVAPADDVKISASDSQTVEAL